MTDISTEIMFKSFTGMLLGPVALLLLNELSIFKISPGEVGLIKIELALGDLSHSEKWWRDGGILDRTFEPALEKKSLKVSEINFGSELIELLIWREISELDLVLSDIFASLWNTHWNGFSYWDAIKRRCDYDRTCI